MTEKKTAGRPKKSKLLVSRMRELVLDIMDRSSKPLSASEIQTALEILHIKAHRSSVYRELESLLKEKIITEVDLGEGKKRYELNWGDHHHHFICKNCNKVTHIHLNELEQSLIQAQKQLSKDQGFKVTDHTLELYGTCGGCQ